MVDDPIVERIRGPVVPILPAFAADEGLDLESTTRWVEWLLSSGIPIVWTTYGTSHFMMLDDREIHALTEAVAAATKGRAVFIASTAYHWSTAQCISFTEFCGRAGVDVVKVQVDWRMRPSNQSVIEHYQRIAASSPVPLFAYSLGQGLLGSAADITGLATTTLEALLTAGAIIGMKNDSGDFYEQARYLEVARRLNRRFEPVTGGSMAAFLFGHLLGARAFATGVGMIAPHWALEFWRCLERSAIDQAATIVVEREEPVKSLFGSMGGWSAYRYALSSLGFFASDQVRFPFAPVTPGQRAEIDACLALHALKRS